MTRIAHVWTKRGLMDVPVKEFPQSFVVGRWIYDADLGPTGELLVRVKGGVETVDYRSRRMATHADAADLAEAPTVAGFPHDSK